MKDYKINKKIISQILFLVIISNIFINVIYSAYNAYHKCDHQICQVCVNIEKGIESISKCGQSIDFSYKFICLNEDEVIYLVPYMVSHIEHNTLVSMKVRLDI